jgi:DNA-binding NtrC family response regulator
MNDKEDKSTHLPLPTGKRLPAMRSDLVLRGIRDLAQLRANKTKVLVVEDDEFSLEIFREKLELEGYQTEGAGNGVEALERLLTFNADLVLSDFRMPVMMGDILLRHCQDNHPGLPVILMTGGGWLTNREAIKIGAAGFIKKPFSFDDLIKLIESVTGACLPAVLRRRVPSHSRGGGD